MNPHNFGPPKSKSASAAAQTCWPSVHTPGRATTAASELVIVCIVTTVPTHAYSLFYSVTNNIYCMYMGLPRLWWLISELHVQAAIVEHHYQLEALLIPVASRLNAQ